jgi:hypothetical protein
MSRTILDPEYANSLNGLFSGATPINVASVNVGVSPNNVVLSANAPGSLLVGGGITTSAGLTAQNSTLTLGVSPAATVVSSNAAGSLLVSGNLTSTGTMTAQTGTLTLGVSPAAVVLTGTTGNVAVAGSITTNGATIDGECSATTFRGGIGYLNSYVTPTSTISPGGTYTNAAVVIPNFIGSATSAYVISINTSTDPAIPFNPYVASVVFVAAQVPTNSTLVSVQLLNASTIPFNSYDVYFSIIAMN